MKKFQPVPLPKPRTSQKKVDIEAFVRLAEQVRISFEKQKEYLEQEEKDLFSDSSNFKFF